MAISLKTAGTWAEYTTDLQTVAIPGTPAAGDRMFLWVQWKDQGITLATPSGWNLISGSNFSDGTVGTGNGLGSMRQSVFYRDWQSGDAAPQLDFSTATGLLAEAVIMLWTKGGGDTWGVPSAASAAWSASAGPQTITDDASTNVGDGAVVMAGVAIRDDSATFTRGTTDIDGSGITWNGNYVESPATHYSTTTGNDHSGDLGHRFVTTGASAQLTCSVSALSASETGSIVWIIQGLAVTIDLAPSPVAVTPAVPAPTVGLSLALAPAPVAVAPAVTSPTLALALALAPSPIATTPAVPAPSVTVDQSFAPAPVAALPSVPAPSLALALALEPAPVAAIGAIPASLLQLANELAPAPVAASVAVPASDLATEVAFSPAPILASLAVTASSLEQALSLVPAPVNVALGVPDSSLALEYTLTPAPVPVSLEIPASSLALALELSPAPVAVQLGIPAPLLGLLLDLAPAPIVALLVVPNSTVQAGSGQTDLEPDPIVALLEVPASSLSLALALVPDPVAAILATPEPALGLANTLEPSPVPLSPAVPAPLLETGGISLLPSPVPVLLVVPNSIVAGAAAGTVIHVASSVSIYAVTRTRARDLEADAPGEATARTVATARSSVRR